MKNKLNPIWWEYEGQEFKTGDCSPIDKPTYMKLLIWKNDGDWNYEYPHLKVSSEVLEGLINMESSEEVREVLKRILDEWGGLERTLSRPDWYDSLRSFNKTVDGYAEIVYYMEEELRELNPSHDYFRYDSCWYLDEVFSDPSWEDSGGDSFGDD